MRIPYKDMVYIDRHSYIHLCTGKIIKCKYKMYEWIEPLSNLTFGQSYKSIIINFKYVTEIQKRDVDLLTKEKLPISKHYKETFEKGYLEYIRRTL